MYRDPATDELLLMQLLEEQWHPHTATMQGWRDARIRLYQPRPDLIISMPDGQHWPLMTAEEVSNIHCFMTHPWIPSGAPIDNVPEEDIPTADVIYMSEGDAVADLQNAIYSLEELTRPALYWPQPMSLVQRNSLGPLFALALAAGGAPAPEPEQPPPQLMPKHVADVVLRDAVSRGVNCGITMEPITVDNGSVTSCGHFFQTAAIQHWLTTKTTCPECRQPCAV